VRGVLRWGEPPQEWTVFTRRFLCLWCGSVVVVVPRGLLPRRRYIAATIALALVLYGVERLSHAVVRERVCPARRHGFDAHRRWRTLSRWVDQVRDRGLFGRLPQPAPDMPRRGQAGLFARALAAFSIGPDPIIEVAAMDGALMAISA
jgi:hypothetical protein